MTIQKSLKYEPQKLGSGFIHRIHRSKKNRNFIPPQEITFKSKLRTRKEKYQNKDFKKMLKKYV